MPQGAAKRKRKTASTVHLLHQCVRRGKSKGCDDAGGGVSCVSCHFHRVHRAERVQSAERASPRCAFSPPNSLNTHRKFFNQFSSVNSACQTGVRAGRPARSSKHVIINSHKLTECLSDRSERLGGILGGQQAALQVIAYTATLRNLL